jgi:two-component system, LuxR family, response regulator FixJ
MQRKPTIYIVDDEPEVLEAISHLVKPIEAEVKTYSRADDFLSDFQGDGPGCLVLDVRLPGMSGMELQERLIQARCQMPIIIISGHADIRMAVDAVKAGAVNFLEKPFRPQELFEEIQKTLRSDIERWQHRDEEQSLERKLAVLKAGEREVLDLIMQGKTNEEIARELQLSVRGVEARRAKAMRTLRVDSKSELVRLLRLSIPRSSSKPPS